MDESDVIIFMCETKDNKITVKKKMVLRKHFGPQDVIYKSKDELKLKIAKNNELLYGNGNCYIFYSNFMIESLKIMVLKDKDTDFVLLETGVLIAYNQKEVYKYD